MAAQLAILTQAQRDPEAKAQLEKALSLSPEDLAELVKTDDKVSSPPRKEPKKEAAPKEEAAPK